MSRLLVLKIILSQIDLESEVDSSDIIERIKGGLKQYDVNMYSAWEKSGFDINANSFDGSNLLCLAFKYNYPTIAEYLINRGVSVDIKDNEGKTPLHFANNPYMADMLLNKGAEVNIQDKEGRTPLHVVDDESASIAKMLLDRGAGVNTQDKEGRTPLHLAPGRLSYIAELLLNNGAKIDIQDKEGKTPLHLFASFLKSPFSTAFQPQDDVVKMLLNKGAKIDIQDKEGRTPLHLAASCSTSLCKHFVEILLKNGAEVNIKDNEGKTPLDYAMSSGVEEVIKILTEKTSLHDDGHYGNEGALQMSSEQEVEIDSQDQYEDPFSYYFFS